MAPWTEDAPVECDHSSGFQELYNWRERIVSHLPVEKAVTQTWSQELVPLNYTTP